MFYREKHKNFFKITGGHDWKLRCKNCQKKWDVKGTMFIGTLGDYYDVQGIELGKLHDTVCVACQEALLITDHFYSFLVLD